MSKYMYMSEYIFITNVWISITKYILRRIDMELHRDKEQEWSLTSIFFFKGPFAHDGNGNLVEQQRQKETKIEKMIFCTYL